MYFFFTGIRGFDILKMKTTSWKGEIRYGTQYALAFEYTPTAGWWDMVEDVTYVYDGEIIITHQRDWLNP